MAIITAKNNTNNNSDIKSSTNRNISFSSPCHNTMVFLSLLLLLFGTIPTSSSANVCRALVLSGGGDKGAYEAGVVYGLVNNTEEEDNRGKNKEEDVSVRWDVISGVSVGALNAAASILFEVGEEKAYADKLIDTWSTIQRQDVLRQWPFGEVEGLLFQSGVYDSSPLAKTMTHILAGTFPHTDGEGSILGQTNTEHETTVLLGEGGADTDNNNNFYPSIKSSSIPHLPFAPRRMITFPSLDIDSGEMSVWTEEEHVKGRLVDALMGATAVPGILPAVVVDDVYYTDASVNRAIDVQGAVNRCLESGKAEREEQIQVDIVVCGPTLANQKTKHNEQKEQQGGERSWRSRRGYLRREKEGGGSGRRPLIGFGDKRYNSIELLFRAAMFRSMYITEQQISSLREDFPLVNFRFLVQPTEELPGSSMLDFDRDTMDAMIKKGKEDGRKAVKKWKEMEEKTRRRRRGEIELER
eukprot:GHVS01098073.1.p1 GENE.GHVS01098073.1~~GHVS01098073.1.p1  ORF type:complete len:469 (-),score=117.62 GHVS01098073.1:1405-2811(-)